MSRLIEKGRGGLGMGDVEMFGLPTITFVMLFVIWPLWLLLSFLYGFLYKEGREDEWDIL